MKKFLAIILAFIFVMSLAGTALAAPANPFVDVPAKHWAYDAVAKLAKAGIVDGYGDGTFRGDRTTTRYEMAQVVAKAMARSDKADAELKALIDKLAVEFASELNNLGVRVAKLEEKTRIGWTFESRIRYGKEDSNYVVSTAKGTNQFDWRQRINLHGDVNDNVSYVARLETSRADNGQGNIVSGAIGNQNIGFSLAYFNVKDFLGCIDQLTVGRFDARGITNGLLLGKDGNNDGVLIAKKFGDTTFKAFIADEGGSATSEVKQYNLDFNLGKNVDMNVGYQTANWPGTKYWQATPNPSTGWPHFTTGGSVAKSKSFDVGVQLKFGDIKLTGEYVNTKVQGLGYSTWQKYNAYAVQITNGVSGYFYPVYNIVDPKKAHTDAFALSYRKHEEFATPFLSGFGTSVPYISTGAYGLPDWNKKGYLFAYQNVVSKNVVWTVDYQDLKHCNTDMKFKYWSTSVQFFF